MNLSRKNTLENDIAKKTILLIGNIPPPYGGVPSHIESLAPFLTNNGWNVIVLSAGTPKGTYFSNDVKIFKPRTLENIMNLFNIYNFTFTIRAMFWFLYLCKFSIKLYAKSILFSVRIFTLVRKENVKIISAYHMYAALVSELPSELYNIPFTTTLFGEIYSENSFYKRIVKQVQRVVSKSSVVLSCSNHCAASLSTLGLKTRVLTHYYGIDTDYFKPVEKKMEFRRELGWDLNAKVMIFVGRMTHSMGLHVLIEAIPSLLSENKDLKIIICGATGPLSAEANSLKQKYTDKIKVFENVSKKHLWELYNAADFAVAPSINERACLGLAIIEAMSMRLPVVACEIGGTMEVVKDGITGVLVEPNNSDALKQGVERLFHSFDLRNTGQLARERVLDSFRIQETNGYADKIFTKYCK